jgi:muramoyltetrapeptide carboxypeptidase|tara:strand:- start:56 stop:1078 length:1023 start_codon:yes stop_codon:yes gene_type:complete
MIFKSFIYCLFLLSIVGADIPTVETPKIKKITPNTLSNMIRPAYLKIGDTVAILAPAGVLKQDLEVIEKTKILLKKWGLKVVFGEHLETKENHFAGSDSERASDFQWALDQPNIKAIWCARGGYGALRIIDKLNFKNFKKYPKWIIGYSDITVLHSALNNLGYESIHGMMCVNLTEDEKSIKLSIKTLKSALFGALKSYEIKGHKDNNPGNASGQLVGGNLSLLTATLGSETSLSTMGKIIFIEEIGEYKYHIDRQLQSLKRAGYFQQCSGVIIGDLSKLKTNNPKWGQTIEALILDILEDTNVPVAFGFPAGHELENRALYLGRHIKLNVTKTHTRVSF